MARTAIVWFRRDLRLADNRALTEAFARADGVAMLFVLPDAGVAHGPGAASRAWLAASLRALGADVAALGGALTLRAGPAPEALAKAAAACGATLVTCTRDWTPAGIAEEHAVDEALREIGVELHVAEGQLLVTPEAKSTTGHAYRVFTPYLSVWRRTWRAEEPLAAPERIPAPETPLAKQPPRTRNRMLATLAADAPTADAAGRSGAGAIGAGGPEAAGRVAADWSPGEAGAQARLGEFVDGRLSDYEVGRDVPAERGTSELSPHIAWGEISPRQIAQAVAKHDGAQPFLRQIAWREFAYHVLHAHPKSLDEPARKEWAAMAWRDDPEAFEAWKAGQTGFPLVDAGMRQLAETGWMHNRVRMVAASLLVKDLLIRWQDGAAVFEELLGDFDPALNAFNWQWVAGSGADAAPYFRIFNPALQGQRYDPQGIYVRRWVPELANVPARWLHRPEQAPASELKAAGVVLGKTYPLPIVDRGAARLRALAAFSAMRGERRG